MPDTPITPNYGAVIRGMIIAGELDDQLSEISSIVSQRKRLIAAENVMQFRKGDLVQFSQSVRPQYLRGKHATFVRTEGDKVVVCCPFGRDYGRFSGSGEVRCGMTQIVASTNSGVRDEFGELVGKDDR
jgi:hypothetical protein